MEKYEQLIIRRNQLTVIKEELDSNAPIDSWEGRAYTRTLVELVLVEMKIEEMKKDALQSAQK